MCEASVAATATKLGMSIGAVKVARQPLDVILSFSANDMLGLFRACLPARRQPFNGTASWHRYAFYCI